jgi:cytochrome c oxidase assembly protein subunit 15
LRRLAVVTIGWTLPLVAFGGLVRATDNGLACPDWPRCYGRWVPRQADLPGGVGGFRPPGAPGGLTLANVWIEHTHRLVAMLVGLLIAAIVVWSLTPRYRRRRDVWWPAIVAGVAVNVQAVLGGAVVLRLLRAELVTAHLGMAMVVLASLVALAVNLSLPRGGGLGARPRDLRFARACAAVAALALAQILVGGHVTGVGAGLAFSGFPLFDGALLPVVTGADQAWHVAHRVLGVVLAAVVVVLALRARRQARPPVTDAADGVAEPRAGAAADPRVAADRARRWAVRLPAVAVVLVAVQVALGAGNLASGLSAWTVTPHLAVGSWLWALLALQTMLAYRTAPPAVADRRRAEGAGTPVVAGTVAAGRGRPGGRDPASGPR